MEDLEHLAIIWFGVFVSSFLAKRTNLTAVLYFLAFGSLMVNIGILPVETSPFIEGLSNIGIIIIMFALGFEENSSKFVQGIKRSWGIALFGAIAPFLVAYYTAMYYWGDVNLALMCGLAMTMTAVSLTMVSLRSEGLNTSNAARGIMTSAVLDNIGSLALVALVVPLAVGESEVSITGILSVVLNVFVFFGIVTALGLWIFPSESQGRFMHRIPFIRNHGVRDLLLLGESSTATLAILLLGLVIGIIAHYFSFHPAVGAYMAGLILKKEYFHVDKAVQETAYQNTKHVIDDVAFSWIGPVFFVTLGTRIILDFDIIIAVLPETVVLTAGLFAGQTMSALLAARFTGRFHWHESIMIGFGMLGRAELAFVVLNIGYVEHAIFTEQAFYTLMLTAFWLNISVPVMIRFWHPYYTGEKQLTLRFGNCHINLSREKTTEEVVKIPEKFRPTLIIYEGFGNQVQGNRAVCTRHKQAG
jgi:Kef-type K+ transport system membrane component KefB